MDKVYHGTVHGRTIELSEAPDAADGQQVEVALRFLQPARPWGEGIRASAGAMAKQWSDEDDLILLQIQEDRKHDAGNPVSL
jgi:hypothetical protein